MSPDLDPNRPALGSGSPEHFWTKVPRVGRVGLVVRQTSVDGCGPACAAMLLADRGIEVDQDASAEPMMLPCGAPDLARRLSELSSTAWTGGSLAELPKSPGAVVREICIRHGSWAALLEPHGFRRVGHWVVVDQVNNDGVILLRDPVGEAYGISAEEFASLWSYAMLVMESRS